MQPIQESQTTKPPSWSWMVVTGSVSYLEVTGPRLYWKDDFDLGLYGDSQDRSRLNDTRHMALIGRVSLLIPDLEIHPQKDTDCEIRDSEDQMLGWIRYDNEDLLCAKDIGFMTIIESGDITSDNDSIEQRGGGPKHNLFCFGLIVCVLSGTQLLYPNVYRRVGIAGLEKKILRQRVVREERRCIL